MRIAGDPAWYPVDLATHSYGQGLAATPLQVISAVNTFANGGLLMRPQIVHSVVAADGVRVHEPVVVRRTVSAETAHTVAGMMLGVVEDVPYHLARVDGYRVAGKTGTTIVTIEGVYDPDTTIASFVGFLPYEQPRVTILVKIDEPRGDSNLAGIVAAPVFSTIAADIMEYLRVPPGERQGERPVSSATERGPALDAAFVARALGELLREQRGPDARFRRAVIDSRRVEAGDLFVALPGERTDGHDFAADAVSRGAAGLLLERLPRDDLPGEPTVFVVADALAGLQRTAAGLARGAARPRGDRRDGQRRQDDSQADGLRSP